MPGLGNLGRLVFVGRYIRYQLKSRESRGDMTDCPQSCLEHPFNPETNDVYYEHNLRGPWSVHALIRTESSRRGGKAE